MTLEEALAEIARLKTKMADMVPRERLNAKQAAIDEQAAKVRQLEEQIASAPDPTKAAKRYERLEAKLADLQTEYDSAKQQWATTSALTSAGITDPDDQDIVLHRWSKLGDDRPDLTDWLGAEDGARGDKVLSRILPAADGGQQQAQTQTQTQTRQRPASNNGARPNQSPGQVSNLIEFNKLPAQFKLSQEGRQLRERLLAADTEPL